MFKLSVIVLSILMIPIFIGCQEEDVVYDKDEESLLTRSSKMEKADTTLRMIFESEEDLAYAVSGSMPDAETYGISGSELNPEIVNGTSNFVSMLSNHPVISAQTGYPVSYYEALGYDSLVPNLNFAKLLNIHGEMQVSQEIIRAGA